MKNKSLTRSKITSITPHLSAGPAKFIKADIFSRKGRRIEEINKAIKILKQGGIVVYPTDTAYGLAVDATNEKAVKKLYRLKGRNFNKPVHVLVPGKYYHTIQYDSIWLKRTVRVTPDARKLIKKFWPGALTIVLPLKAKGQSWQMLSAQTGTLGVRYPNHPTAQALVESFGKPITTTSANLSGKPSTYSIDQVKKQFAHTKFKPDFYLDGEKLKKVKPSTIVSLVNDRVKILRQGPISETQIKRALMSS